MDFDQARFNMVAQQIRPWYVLHMPLLDALLEIPRERFVTKDQQELAYAEIALPLPNGGKMLEPTVAARLIQGLALKSADKVLEIGTGSGYITAILSKLAQSVLTVDIDAQQQGRAKKILNTLSLHNIQYKVADGLQGVSDHAPYDAIYLGGSCTKVPLQLKHQLANNGRLVVIAGKNPIMQATIITRHEDTFTEKMMFDTFAEPLANANTLTNPTFDF